ncbi:polyprenyl synthetase family protein [Vallicoccus soli]|uniref:Polyprenyl synthetase family protein n=1 Tax=Vallicoccus soli TaxID=2339232 RepID=A0A3A3YYK6_9ACTN|nr:polyprenyl synthetase family protein [Vallicoccus soli]RJK96851.1 polyprenyl synthetase family protein [Vallicoccus soli]
MSPADPVLDREDLRTRVQKALDDVLARQAAALEDVSVDLAPLVEAATALLSGGKRLRPAFCYWGWRGAGGADGTGIVQAAAALELFQAAALVHDDVMDGSDTRRGMPAAHRRLAALHRGNAWVGSADRFGEAGAILLGDLFLSWSDEVLVASGLGDEELRRGRATFDLMRTQLMGGQYLDMLEQARAATDGSSVERARRVIRFKSAKYSVEHPLVLGGSLAGAGPEQLAAYSAYGLPLGEAFQLRDDVLGVFGDPAETGKPAGDDLREGKRTVLVAMALEQASPAQAAAVQRHLGDPHLDAHGVAVLREVLVDTGALARVEALIEELTARAHAALDGTALEHDARTVLTGLVGAATARSV